MPLLHLRLEPTAEGSNVCDIHLPHEIRTQVMKYKKSVVRYVGDETVGTDQDGDGDARDLQETMIFVDLPFFTGYEITSNVGGGGLLPVHLPDPIQQQPTTNNDPPRHIAESDYHINLKAESLPQKFQVRTFGNDGITPKPFTLKSLGTQTNAENNHLVQVDLYFEYETNNLFF